ncbi:putative defense protein isoform X2 [Mizuhopecten yessoensis]|uniref:Defense protein n=1 Tax=Mizuhopecten yessoensis TaxID=6573 RepID=A0A210QKC0_MIZYE|nr:putative defense protein isoform X2 [Mizuhopecten yessoensis]OWF49189.1 defense protein [Mizuhopecten yessoensis]
MLRRTDWLLNLVCTMLSVCTVMFLGSALTVPCFGYGLGPPLGACVNMWPSHGIDAQSTDPPYTITVSKDTYTAGEQLTVFVNTTDMYPEIQFFEGLMIQARRAKCDHVHYQDAVGSFTLEGGEDFLGLLNCQGGVNSTVAHRAHDHIYNRTFTWIAPSTSVGHVYFRGTIVRRKITFWTTLKSAFIRDTSDSSTPESCYVQTKLANTVTNAANIRILSNISVLVSIVIWWFRI